MGRKEDFFNDITEGYKTKGDYITFGSAMLDGETIKDAFVKIPLKTLNRHGSFIDNQVNLVSGKNFFGFKMTTSWSLFGSLFSNTFCCRCKNSDEDFVLNLDSIKEYEDDKIEDINHFNDSYLDYWMNLETIIKNENGDNNLNNNNSFI